METLEKELWIDYRQGDGSARERLLERYLPLAKRLASIVYAARISAEVEFGDYLQLAYVGLLEAMQRYRLDSEAQFTTFATYRIRGSILNGIPKMTERGDYIGYLRRMQRERTDSLLEAQDKSASAFNQMFDLVVGIALTHQLDELVQEDSAGVPAEAELYASRAYDEMQQTLKSILAQLPERDRQIVYYHYFCQMSFDDIAELFALTKGRVSQLHKRALDSIRDALRMRRVAEFY